MGAGNHGEESKRERLANPDFKMAAIFSFHRSLRTRSSLATSSRSSLLVNSLRIALRKKVNKASGGDSRCETTTMSTNRMLFSSDQRCSQRLRGEGKVSQR